MRETIFDDFIEIFIFISDHFADHFSNSGNCAIIFDDRLLELLFS